MNQETVLFIAVHVHVVHCTATHQITSVDGFIFNVLMSSRIFPALGCYLGGTTVLYMIQSRAWIVES